MARGRFSSLGGIFRNATRTNHNASASLWPGRKYPYIDLLDNFDGDTPSEDERSQLNVYHPGGAVPDSSGPDNTQPTEQPPTRHRSTPRSHQARSTFRPIVRSRDARGLRDRC